MTAIAHTLISLPFGVYLANPLIIFLAALATHLLLDTLLHWNIYPAVFGRAFHLLAIADAGSALLISWLVLGDRLFTPPVLAAIIGGNIVDAIHVLWDMVSPRVRTKYFSWIEVPFRFHTNLQLETVSFARGIVWQVVLVFVALVAIR